MKPDGFLADLHRKPEVLSRLATTLAQANPWSAAVPAGVERVVLLGMGSSAYAGGVAAARMRARGIVASSELASSRLLPDWGAGALVVATSASGGSAETLDALTRVPGAAHTVALTNTPGPPPPAPTCWTPNPTGDQRFPIFSWVRPGAISARPRTGCVPRSRAR